VVQERVTASLRALYWRVAAYWEVETGEPTGSGLQVPKPWDPNALHDWKGRRL